MANARTLADIEHLLQVALNCLAEARQSDGDRAANASVSAAWRIADAGLMLRQELEAAEIGA
jgi:hypothetical protein